MGVAGNHSHFIRPSSHPMTLVESFESFFTFQVLLAGGGFLNDKVRVVLYSLSYFF